MKCTPFGLSVTALILGFGVIIAGPAVAQRGRPSLLAGPLEAGVRGGRDFENHAWSLGAQLRVPVSRSLDLRPSGDLFFPREGKNGRQLNLDAALRFGQELYAGGGMAFVDLAESAGKDRGHNLFFGVNDRPGKRLTSFFEFRWTFYNDTSPFRLALGFNYALTGRWR